MAAQRNTDTDGKITAVAACSSAILALQDHIDSFPRLAAAAVAAIEEVYDVPSERGRIKDSRPNISRSACPWYDDYLSRTPVYDSSRFRRRFRIPLRLYRKIEMELLERYPHIFEQKVDGLGRAGHTHWQKNAGSSSKTGYGQKL
jgi:hypothetical protein